MDVAARSRAIARCYKRIFNSLAFRLLFLFILLCLVLNIVTETYSARSFFVALFESLQVRAQPSYYSYLALLSLIYDCLVVNGSLARLGSTT